MKKAVIILALLMTVSLASCSNNAAVENKPAENNTKVVETENTPDSSEQTKGITPEQTPEPEDTTKLRSDASPEQIKEYLRSLPSDHETITSLKDVFVSSIVGDYNTNLWDDFALGKTDSVTVCLFTTEGDPIYTSLIRNEQGYLAVTDDSRDEFRGVDGSDGFRYTQNPYLNILEYDVEDEKYIEVVTSRKADLTYDELFQHYASSFYDPENETLNPFYIFSMEKK